MDALLGNKTSSGVSPRGRSRRPDAASADGSVQVQGCFTKTATPDDVYLLPVQFPAVPGLDAAGADRALSRLLLQEPGEIGLPRRLRPEQLAHLAVQVLLPLGQFAEAVEHLAGLAVDEVTIDVDVTDEGGETRSASRSVRRSSSAVTCLSILSRNDFISRSPIGSVVK